MEEQLSNLAREAGVDPSAPPTSMKTISRPADNDLSIGELALRFRRFSVGSIHWCCCLVVVVLRSYGDDGPLGTSTFDTGRAERRRADCRRPVFHLAQQLQPMTRDLAALSQAVEQLKVRQEQLVRDNENVASQLKASQEEMARNNSIIDQIKATQIQMARQSQTLTERLNASQEQLARVIANASEPKVTPEEPKVSPEERKVMPEIPLPRPRQLANVAQTPTPARPQAKKPQPSLAWPWSVR